MALAQSYCTRLHVRMHSPRVPSISDSLSFLGVTHEVVVPALRAKKWYGADRDGGIGHGEDARRRVNG
jgi:hypothetical protein